MFRSLLNIQVAALCYPIEWSIVINVLNILVVNPDDGMNKQTETDVSKAILWQFCDKVVPNEQFFPD
jgi:hypothetical protein